MTMYTKKEKEFMQLAKRYLKIKRQLFDKGVKVSKAN